MLKHLQNRIVQVAFDVLFGALVLRYLLFIQALRHVSFEVDLNCVHSVDAFLVPRCLVVENRS